MLKKYEYVPNVYMVYAGDSTEVSKAFIRFSEYSENAAFKGNKTLSVKNVLDWWNATDEAKRTGMDYYEYWEGYNISGNILVDFKRTPTLYPFTKQETELLKLFEGIPDKQLASSNIIGFSVTNNVVVDHEVAHIWFSIDPAYKSTQIYNISQLDKKVYAALAKHLEQVMGYNKSVILDEIQAYLSTYVDTLDESFPGLKDLNLKNYTHPFVSTFKKYLKYRPIPEIDKLPL